MKPLAPVTSVAVSRVIGLLVLFGSLIGTASTLAAQDTPPIGGVTGTIALEGTVDSEYTAANTVIVKTMDGVRHVFHYASDLLVHGGKGTGADALRGLRDGSTVVVHYTLAGSEASAKEIDRIGDDGLRVTEGTVIRIDRSRQHITVRFDNGRTETFQLTDRAAVDAGQELDRAPDGTARVIVYYTDEAGHKVAHFFKKSS